VICASGKAQSALIDVVANDAVSCIPKVTASVGAYVWKAVVLKSVAEGVAVANGVRCVRVLLCSWSV